jgi:peroxiredoxin
MSKTYSEMLPLGTEAPEFTLPDIDGKLVSFNDFKGSLALSVIFMCNHCPYVKHVQKELLNLIREYQKKGIAFVGINSNDVESYPEDHPDEMKKNARKNNFTFPYLYDQDQSIAKAYHAACTPDFFLFDKNFKLVYRGQMDDSRPGNDIPVTGNDLRSALNCILEEKPVASLQKPSIGCNIKWKKGNSPDYFTV